MQEIATLVNSLAMTGLVLHVIASERSERGNLIH
jgi:hypothetical protein